MTNIKFGTDGWRAIVGKDFTEENVRKTALAIAKYQIDTFGVDKLFIIGYDPRNMADTFAKYTAEILSGFGFNVWLSDKIVPTPVIAYAAKHYNASGIMFTASHNPPEYLGMKFIPDYAGPATEEITKKIVENIDADLTKYNFSPKKYVFKSFEDVYSEHIKTLINFEKIKSSGLKLNYDGLYGADSYLFTKLLKEYDIPFEAENLNHDPNFGGKMPDPKEKYLLELKEKCKNTNLVGLSNDGDGDRFGVFDENGVFVTANEIIVILLKHLVENKHFTGKLVKTVGASVMNDIVAKKLNIETIETPVGFKWVGKAMRDNDVIIGGEESGGLSIKGHIPEKDGIIANFLILEAMAYYGKTLAELQQDLHKNVLNSIDFINTRIDMKLENQSEQDVIINKFRDVKTILPLDVIGKNTMDGLKLYLSDNLSWILIRKSGTEPLLRIYFESDSQDKIEALKKSVAQIAED
ncbi:MAG: hypothetical protein PHV37_08135 [Candidatus Gastranaerophilales bacterium]|nr:hypothetical protein [Candidatus Gastranaerophilales bacterium]